MNTAHLVDGVMRPSVADNELLRARVPVQGPRRKRQTLLRALLSLCGGALEEARRRRRRRRAEGSRRRAEGSGGLSKDMP